MMTLRTRIAALLIAAILTVVGLATLAAIQALHPPAPAATMEPVARQLHILAAIADADPDLLRAAGGVLQDRPAGGTRDDILGGFLAGALARTGEGFPATVSRLADAPTVTASVDLGEGRWLIAPIPDFSPPEGGWIVFAFWIAAIVAGTSLISLRAARKLTRPLELLESAASRIGADATLQPIAETGPAEIRATAHALNRLSARLAVAMESRMRLVAAAGHDLRTPMTRMRLRAEFIEDEAERAKWLADLEELDLIADSAIRLVREEVSHDGVEVLRLDRLVRDIAAELEAQGQPAHPGPLAATSVQAGPLALKRALRNLILNAASHGGGATLTLTRQHDQAILTVTDAGPGIPENLLGQVFEPFFRVDPSRRKLLPGAGLGLAISREIIERFGGRIAIENLAPHGLKQTVILPAADPERDPKRDPERDPG